MDSVSELKLINRCVKAYDWTEKFAREVFDEYMCFIEDVRMYFTETEVDPPLVIDLMWRLHIIDTNDYRLFCDNTDNGEYIDRTADIFNKTRVFDHNRRYVKTLTQLNNTKPLNVDIWTVPTYYIKINNHGLTEIIEIPLKTANTEILNLGKRIQELYDIDLSKNIISFVDLPEIVEAFKEYVWYTTPIKRENKKRPRETQNKESGLIKIRVMFNQHIYGFVCCRSETFLNLKDRIFLQKHIPIDTQMLWCGDEKCNDQDELISMVCDNEDSIVNLFLKNK